MLMVAITDSFHHLFKQSPGVAFGKIAVRLESFEKLSSIAKTKLLQKLTQ